jgi:hypothetical protein
LSEAVFLVGLSLRSRFWSDALVWAGFRTSGPVLPFLAAQRRLSLLDYRCARGLRVVPVLFVSFVPVGLGRVPYVRTGACMFSPCGAVAYRFFPPPGAVAPWSGPGSVRPDRCYFSSRLRGVFLVGLSLRSRFCVLFKFVFLVRLFLSVGAGFRTSRPARACFSPCGALACRFPPRGVVASAQPCTALHYTAQHCTAHRFTFVCIFLSMSGLCFCFCFRMFLSVFPFSVQVDS